MNLSIGIDASRCRSGGAINHLIGILSSLEPTDHNISEIHLWTYPELIELLPMRKWLHTYTPKYLEKNLFYQLFGKFFI